VICLSTILLTEACTKATDSNLIKLTKGSFALCLKWPWNFKQAISFETRSEKNLDLLGFLFIRALPQAYDMIFCIHNKDERVLEERKKRQKRLWCSGTDGW